VPTCVYTTGQVSASFDPSKDSVGRDVVQRLCPGTGTSAPAVRWVVDGGAGGVETNSYLSGIDINPLTPNLVYYSESLGNNIGELDTNTNFVRRWSVVMVGASGPRQLRIAAGGLIWVVTGSGHLVSLNPSTGEMTAFVIPASIANNPFGLDPNGVIGYTGSSTNKVGMLIPDGTSQIVPVSGPCPTPPCLAPTATKTLTGTSIGVTAGMGTALPQLKSAVVMVTDDLIDGTYVEADLMTSSCNTGSTCSPVNSTGPLGIVGDPLGGIGTYFYAVGGATPTKNRIGHAALPIPAAGLVTGGGWIAEGSSNSTFGFVASRKTLGGTVKGHLTYQNHLTGDQVQSLDVTDLEFLNNTATFSGTCKTGCTIDFRVDIADNGNPNSTPRDTFSITKDPVVLGGTTDGGPLQGGNVLIHRQQ
jgi:hypothetical protein